MAVNDASIICYLFHVMMIYGLGVCGTYIPLGNVVHRFRLGAIS